MINVNVYTIIMDLVALSVQPNKNMYTSTSSIIWNQFLD